MWRWNPTNPCRSHIIAGFKYKSCLRKNIASNMFVE